MILLFKERFQFARKVLQGKLAGRLRLAEKGVGQEGTKERGEETRRHPEAPHCDGNQILVAVSVCEKKQTCDVPTLLGRHGNLHKVRAGTFRLAEEAGHSRFRRSGFEVVMRKNDSLSHPMGFWNKGLHEAVGV